MTAPSGDPLGSDHFPIWLNYDTALVGPRPRRWNWRKADWSAFETRLEAGFSSDNALIPDSVESFTSEIIKAAEASKILSKLWEQGGKKAKILAFF